MFTSYRVPCRDHLKEGDNELELIFDSAWYRAKEEEAANGGPMALCGSLQVCRKHADGKGTEILVGCIPAKLSTVGVGTG